MVQIGQERHFNALLSSKADPLLLARLSDRAPESVLDLGAFSGEALCLLRHWCPSLNHLEGWETSKEEKVLAMLRQADRLRMPNARYRSIYERYCMHVNEMGLPNWKRIATEDEYRKTINVRYETRPELAKPFKEWYDMLIISNVLHTFDPATLDTVLEKLNGLVRSDSLIYIHTKARPQEGFAQGTSDDTITRICERLAQQWQLRTVAGPLDHEGQHMTYTNL